jgi:hypothetical protein
MARRLFMHVGTPKSGTTYLQNTLWEHQKSLQAIGFLLPLNGMADHWTAAKELRNQKAYDPGNRRGALKKLVAAINSWPGDVIVSSELFGPATPRHIEKFWSQVIAEEKHIIVTARDTLRQVPSEWHEGVKNGNARHFREFVALASVDRNQGFFWQRHNVAAIARRWGKYSAPNQVHILTVPNREAGPDELWRRFASIIGIDPIAFSGSQAVVNESIGNAATELVRRIIAGSDLGTVKKQELRRQGLRRRLVLGVLVNYQDQPIGCPIESQPWFIKQSSAIIKTIENAEYHVVGDLQSLQSKSDVVPDFKQPEDWQVLHAGLFGALGLLRERDSFRLSMAAQRQARKQILRDLEAEVAAAQELNNRLRSFRGSLRTIQSGIKRRLRRFVSR